MSMPKNGNKATWQSSDGAYDLPAPASPVVAGRSATPTDTARLDWLGTHLAGAKWADALDSLRPTDADGEYTEKYIGGPESLRAAIDAAMSAPALPSDE